jgi:amidophosphoribosyltransferase
VMFGESVAAIRDPQGFRPLYVGWKDGIFYAASETCALFYEGSMEYREVLPGEIVIATRNSEARHTLKSIFLPKAQRCASCVFELIYFARPDSGVFGSSVHMVRKRLGAALADIDPVRPDIVVPVPDSGNIAAIGYSERSGVPFDFGLSRNHYAGRSFIMPTKGQRELAVRMKLHAVPEVVSGKKVVMIDDSLVRGTTGKIIVRLLKEAGAKEVHVRLSSPEIHWPCYYGIDIPTREELISNRKSPTQIAEEIKADSVLFLPEDRMLACLDKPREYCCACFDGNYPCPVRS